MTKPIRVEGSPRRWKGNVRKNRLPGDETLTAPAEVLVAGTRVELVTSSFSGMRYYQLSYPAIKWDNRDEGRSTHKTTKTGGAQGALVLSDPDGT